MPRIARQIATSGIYHIMLRGINRQDIFTDDTDRQRFLQLLEDLQHEYDDQGNIIGQSCCFYAYCLMSNHVHLLYRQGTQEIEQSMKSLGISYAQYYNRKYGRVGHLFQDRYRSEPCEDLSYFITLLRYIHQNPVKAHICTSPEDYPWSSWLEYITPSELPTICNVNVPLRRLQQANFSLQDLMELVQEQLPDDCGCIDIEDQEIIYTLTDDQVRDLLLQLSHTPTIAQFQQLPLAQQTHYILQASHQGAAMKKLSRITGISYRQINKIVKRNSNNS